MDFGYYPGCSLTGTAKEYDLSVRKMCEGFGISLKEIEDWNCCGASPVHALNEKLSLALPMRNLIKAKIQGLQRILSPCPACQSHMLMTNNEWKKNKNFQEEMKKLFHQDHDENLELRHLVDFLYYDIGLDKIRSKTIRPLTGLKVVSYYGCLNRLPGIEMDDKENPVMMDEIITALGGEALDWSHKVECCGAGFSLTITSVVQRLIQDILNAARRKGAHCVAVVCPLCQSNLDMRQKEIERKVGDSYEIPVVYLSQLVLLAQGKRFKEVGFEKHFTSCKILLSFIS